MPGGSARAPVLRPARDPAYSLGRRTWRRRAPGLLDHAARMRRHLRTVAVLLVAGALMALFLRNTDLRQVGAGMAGAARLPLVLALLLTGCTYMLRALRWQYLLLPIGRVRFATALT